MYKAAPQQRRTLLYRVGIVTMHARPTSHTLLNHRFWELMQVNVSRLRTIGLNSRVLKGTQFSRVNFPNACFSKKAPTPPLTHIFLRIKPCRAPRLPACLAGCHPSAPAPLGCFLLEAGPPSSDCTASRLFLASPVTAGLKERPGPRGKCWAPTSSPA